MRIHIVAKKINVTPSFKKFIDSKLGILQRFVKSFEKEGELDCFVEVSRTTRHHKQGDVFYAEIMIRFPGKTIRSETRDVDARIAIVSARDTLKNEIIRYKEKTVEKRNK